MIHSLLDHIIPDASDDEDDERPEPRFELHVGGAAPSLASAPGKKELGIASAISAAVAATPAPGAVQPEACRALVLCGPGAGVAYALSAFQLSPLPWTFEVAKELRESFFPPPPRSPKFFAATGAGAADAAPVAVVFLDAPIAPDFAAAWAEAMLEAFSGASEVVLLDRVYRAGWFATGAGERPQEPHLCGLWTSAWGPESPCGPRFASLPSPNSVEGVGASLLAECESARRRCLVALALQDGAHLGEGSLHAFSGLAPLLRRLALLPAGEQKPKYSEALRQVVSPLSMSIYA